MGFSHFDSGALYGPEGDGSVDLSWSYLGPNAQIVNSVNLVPIWAEYAFTDRISLTASNRFQFGIRYLPVFDTNKEVVARYSTKTNGFGDTTLVLKSWILKPSEADRFNFQVGLGVKIPTGSYDQRAMGLRWDAATGKVVNNDMLVDQSMQNGDGGWGIPVSLSAYLVLHKHLSLYFDGRYLFNVQNTNGVMTGKTGRNTYLSIPDEFAFSLGAAGSIPYLTGLGLSLGLKFDGVPVEDAIGGSDGFRRPGYSLGLDPTISYSFLNNIVAVNVPWFFYNRKLPSVGDQEAGTPAGLAAFAHWALNISWVHKFQL